MSENAIDSENNSKPAPDTPRDSRIADSGGRAHAGTGAFSVPKSAKVGGHLIPLALIEMTLSAIAVHSGEEER